MLSPRDANALYKDDGTARLSRRRLADLENLLFALEKRDPRGSKKKGNTKSSSSSAAPASAPPSPASVSPTGGGQATATASPKSSSPSSGPTPAPTNQPSSQGPSNHRDWFGSAGSGLSVASQFSELLPKSSDPSAAIPTDTPSPPSSPPSSPPDGGTTDPSSQPPSQGPPSSPGGGPLSLIPPTPKERRAALYDATTGYPPLPAKRPGYPQVNRRTPQYSGIPAAVDYVLARRQAQLERRRAGRSAAGKSPDISRGGGSGPGVGDVLNGMNAGMDIANTLLGGGKSSGGGGRGGGGGGSTGGSGWN